MPWKIQPIRGQDYRCIFCGICTTVYWVPFEDFSKSHLRNSSTPANHYEHFQSRPEIFRRFSKISENLKYHKNIWKLLLNHFQSFPKISEEFPKILKNNKNIWKLLLNRIRSFPKISEDFWTLPKISKDFPRILKNHKNIGKHFWTVSEVFQKFLKIAKDFTKFLKSFFIKVPQ